MAYVEHDEAQRQLLALIGRGDLHTVACPFLLKHGRFCRSQPWPKSTHAGRGKIGLCYANAYRLMKNHGARLGLVYVEGLCIPEGENKPLFHGWCTDEAGNVYDPTWDKASVYFGIPFRRDFVLRTIQERERAGEEERFGFLLDWKKGFRLIRGLGDKPDLWKQELLV